ncbi:MAG: transposase [Acidobacteria bacterium]|nr:transposase [Acidobacteriota bacterium]
MNLAPYTSQDCSQCGSRVRKSLALREHRCINCGFVAHRDHNAAS